MISSSFSRLSLCAFLAINSFGQASQQAGVLAVAPVVPVVVVHDKCTKPYFKAHTKIAALAAVIATLSFIAKPTKGDHELSEELFLNDTWTWLRNAFGWLPKDAKIVAVDEETGLPIYKPGYEGQGFVGVMSNAYKTVLPAAALITVIKNIEPLCQMLGIFNQENTVKFV